MSQLKEYAWAVLITAAATAIGWPLYHGFRAPGAMPVHHIADTNILMLYLMSVLIVATRFHRNAAILASILGVIAFDLCFVPPYLTLNVDDEQYLITFAVMLLTALTISTLTHSVRTHSLAAKLAWERAEAEFLRNTLLSSVSHDLRTPVSAITGAASALVDSGLKLSEEARSEMIDTIYTEAERMERLINNLLDMTRLESGGVVLKREWIPVAEVVGSALRHHKKRLANRIVKSRLPADLPMVQIDSGAIEQVLVNLIDNALQYSPAESAIDVDGRATESAVMIEVADRGPGLPKDAEKRVFDKFFRASPGKAKEGVGLGLAICRGIVEAHGGKITAANRAGGGAVFCISLPRTGTPPSVDGSA